MTQTYNVTLSIGLEFQTNVNIGSSFPVKSRADVPVQKMIKSGKRYIFIPGSTLKGVLRSAMIKVAKLLGHDVAPRVKPDKIMKSDDIVTRVMGKPWSKESKIFIDPIYLDEDNIIVLPHITIDDKSGVSKEGSLFTMEYIPLGTRCSTNIYGYGLDMDESRLLFVSIAELNYTTIGKSGLIKAWINLDKSEIPDELRKDPIIMEVLEVLGSVST